MKLPSTRDFKKYKERQKRKMKKITRIIATLLSLVMVLTMGVACKKKNDDAKVGNVKFSDVKLDKGVVATVNDVEVFLEEVKFYIAQYCESIYAQNGMAQASKAEKENFWNTKEGDITLRETLYNSSIDAYVGLVAIVHDAKAKGIDVTEEELDASLGAEGMAEAIDYYKTTYSVTDDAIRSYQRNQLIYEKYATEYIDKDERMDVSDDEIKEKFQEEYIKAQHILKMTVNQETRQPLSETEIAQAKENIDSILAKVREPGADFKAIMLEESEDPGSIQQPDGYVFKEGEMVTEFYETAKSLKENEISEPVKTSYGYHIIKRLPIDLEKDIETCRDSIENAIKTDAFNEILNERKAAVDIKADYSQLYAIEGILY